MKRAFGAASLILLAAVTGFAAKKKVTSPVTTAANEQVDLEATIVLDKEEIVKALGADPGDGVVLLKVKFVPKVDTPLQVSPDDFILLSHDDGERSKPFAPAELAGAGAMQERTKVASKGKSGISGGLGGLYGGGGGSSPGNSPNVTVSTTMNDNAKGDQKLLTILKQKELPEGETTKTVEGYLYFPLDGKHKLKNLIVMYRGPAGKLDLEFVH